jgi:hypothetical protein
MVLLLADLVHFRHRRPGVLDLDLDSGQPAKMDKATILQLHTCLSALNSNRIHSHVLPCAGR